MVAKISSLKGSITGSIQTHINNGTFGVFLQLFSNFLNVSDYDLSLHAQRAWKMLPRLWILTSTATNLTWFSRNTHYGICTLVLDKSD